MMTESAGDQKPEKKKTDEDTFDGITQLDGVEGLMQRLDEDNTRDLLEKRMTPEKQAAFELLEEKLVSEAIELHLDLKFHMKPWKKALIFSFLFYLIILFIFIVIITFIKKDFDPKLVSIISGTYLTALMLGFRRMYKIFKEKFSFSI